MADQKTTRIKRKPFFNVYGGLSALAILMVIAVTYTAITKEPASRPVHAAPALATPAVNPTPTPQAKPTATAQKLDTFSIAKIKVNASVLHLGTATDGTIAVPDNLKQLSVFNQYQLPGQAGNIIISGHLGAPNQVGVFRDLKKLSVDDVITYTQVDGTVFHYKVIKKSSYNPDDPAAKVDIYTPTTLSLMHIITCDGIWDEASRTYSKRLIVDAQLVP